MERLTTGAAGQHEVHIYCTPEAVLAYEQWMTYPMKNLFEDQYGTTAQSVVSAYATNYINVEFFPLGVFDVRVVKENEDEDDAKFVTIDPSDRDWHAELTRQLQAIAPDVIRPTLVTETGVFIDKQEVSKLLSAHQELFRIRPSKAIDEDFDDEDTIAAKFTAEMSIDDQLDRYAVSLAKRVYATNKIEDLRPFVDDRVYAAAAAVSVSKRKGLDKSLIEAFGWNSNEFYTRVASFIRSNVRKSISVLKITKLPVDQLRRSFVEDFDDVSFAGWISSALEGETVVTEQEVEEEEESDESIDEEATIDCSYDSYSDVVYSDNEEDEMQLGAKFSNLKKAVRNLRSRSKYVELSLMRTTQGSKPQRFSWTGATALEPGDVIMTSVRAAKAKESKKKMKKAKPTTVIIDFQMRNRRAPSSPWLVVQTVEVLLPENGKIDGPMFVVPLDDQAFRIVVSTRRPDEGWQMVDIEGEYEFSVDPYGTKGEKRRNYPVTWEQVRSVRYNQDLRAKYSIPEFIFRARAYGVAPFPFKRPTTGEVVDYFEPTQRQQLEDERMRTVSEQRENGIDAFIAKMKEHADFKAYAVAEVRHVIYAINNNLVYMSEFLPTTLDYDDEYNTAMQTPIESKYSTMDSKRRYKRQMELSTIGVKYVSIPPTPIPSKEISEETAVRFAAGTQFIRPGAGRDIVVPLTTPVAVAVPSRVQSSTRARIAPTVLPSTVTTSTNTGSASTSTGTSGSSSSSSAGTSGTSSSSSDSSSSAVSLTRATTPKVLLNFKGVANGKKLQQQHKENEDKIKILEDLVAVASELEKLNTPTAELQNRKKDLEDLINLIPGVIQSNLTTEIDKVDRELRSPAFSNAARKLSEEIQSTLDGQPLDAFVRKNSLNAIPTLDPTLKANFDNAFSLFDALSKTIRSFSTLAEIQQFVAAKLALDDAYDAANSSTIAPISSQITEDAPISIEALFDQVAEEQMGVVDQMINYVVMTGDAVRHTFDKILATKIKMMDPRYFGAIFLERKQYIILVPDGDAWDRIASDLRYGLLDYGSFLRDYTFEVPAGGLFSHSRRISMVSLNGRNTVELKRTYDTKRNATTIQLRIGERRFSGMLDTHIYAVNYKIHSAKFSGWTGF